ncbi:MAG: ABC transporter ATP-binding protein [Candidatus Bathyarchaeia archaeon]
MLEVKNLTVHRGELCVLRDLSLKVDKGEVVALLGPNCAGKTTLLETIVGVIKPSSGKVIFQGEDITTLPSSKRIAKGLSGVFGREYLFHDMTVQENLELGMYMSPERKNFKETVEGVYKLFPKLRTLSKKYVNKLSGGEQQMVSLARAIIGKPSFLMLDEPTSGLAPKIASEIFGIIADLKKAGTTILLVEQYVMRALQISDRVYILSSGKIVLESKPKALLSDKKLSAYYLGLY